MVGDTEDRKRWERVRALSRAAHSQRERAIRAETAWERRQALEHADRLARLAYAETV